MAEPAWHRALRSEDLGAGKIAWTRAGRVSVLVGRLSDGQAVAFATRCPHQDTPLEEGTIWDDHVRCAKHQYLYDPRTGENVSPARTARPGTLWKLAPRYLPTFPVEERDGWVWVGEEPNPPPPAYDPAAEEPPMETEPPVRATAEEEEPPARPQEPVKTVRVHVGARFEIRLPTNPLPGCSWETEVAKGLVEVVDAGLTELVKGVTEPPRWRVRLLARAAGTDDVRCSFLQPWDREPSEVRRYEVVIVAPPSPGTGG